MAASASGAHAQTPTPPPAPVVTEIVVTGERPAVETRVDRRCDELTSEGTKTFESKARFIVGYDATLGRVIAVPQTCSTF